MGVAIILGVAPQNDMAESVGIVHEQRCGVVCERSHGARRQCYRAQQVPLTSVGQRKAELTRELLRFRQDMEHG
jgi:hypothetical protein